jgi:hypothetical protein
MTSLFKSGDALFKSTVLGLLILNAALSWWAKSEAEGAAWAAASAEEAAQFVGAKAENAEAAAELAAENAAQARSAARGAHLAALDCGAD